MILVTGAAGFVGSNLVSTLLAQGASVAGFDNFRLGKPANLQNSLRHPNFRFVKVDLSDLKPYRDALTEVREKGAVTEVWHLAANSDIPAGVEDPSVDMRDTFMTTFNTVQLMSEFGIPILAFASSSAVHGDMEDEAISEETGQLLPISYYGAMKLASEALISAASESHLERSFIFRFPNVIGSPATHGVIFDFIRKLKKNPARLEVLGDGSQQKPYLHVDDLIQAMLYVRQHAKEKRNLFNIGPEDDGVTVKYIADEVRRLVSPAARIIYGEGPRGWVGDVPRFKYALTKLKGLGWQASLNSKQAVGQAIRQMLEQFEREASDHPGGR